MACGKVIHNYVAVLHHAARLWFCGRNTAGQVEESPRRPGRAT